MLHTSRARLNNTLERNFSASDGVRPPCGRRSSLVKPHYRLLLRTPLRPCPHATCLKFLKVSFAIYIRCPLIFLQNGFHFWWNFSTGIIKRFVIRASLLRGNVQHERKNAQVFCGSTQKTRTDHEKLKFAMSKGSGFSGTIPVNLLSSTLISSGRKRC